MEQRIKMKNFWSWNGLRFLVVASVGMFIACGGGASKKVYFGNLADGASVESPIKIVMKAENLIVEPATMGVTEGHGHYHIIINERIASPSEPMIKDEKHIHYGNGESETLLDLPVGKHTLILQFAKGNHVPYDPPIYQQIEITVTKQNKQNVVDTVKVDTTNAVMVDSVKTIALDTAKVLLQNSSRTKNTVKKDTLKPIRK